MRYTFDSSVGRAAVGNFGRFLDNVTTAEQTVAQNSTDRMRGVVQWIWPVTIGVVALVLGFLFLRKKGK